MDTGLILGAILAIVALVVWMVHLEAKAELRHMEDERSERLRRLSPTPRPMNDAYSGRPANSPPAAAGLHHRRIG